MKPTLSHQRFSSTLASSKKNKARTCQCSYFLLISSEEISLHGFIDFGDYIECSPHSYLPKQSTRHVFQLRGGLIILEPRQSIPPVKERTFYFLRFFQKNSWNTLREEKKATSINLTHPPGVTTNGRIWLQDRLGNSQLPSGASTRWWGSADRNFWKRKREISLPKSEGST